MSKFTFKSLLIIVLAIMPMTFFAQNNEENQEKPNNNHYWSIGFDEGATLLFGDNKAFDFKNLRPQIGIFGGYTFAKHFTAYGRLSAGTVRGELENVFRVENASFIQFDVNIAADLVSLIAGYNPDRLVGLIPHVGFGQMHYQARTIVGGQTYKYGYNDEGTTVKGKGIAGRKVVFEIPMGIQFEFNLNRNCALFFDVTTTRTDTDWLDGYATGDHYDWYSAASVGFKYKFRKADPKPAPEPVAPAAPDCEACKEAIQQAVKDAVEEALKNYQPAPKEVAPEEEEAEDAESLENLEKNYEEKDIHLSFKVGKAEVENTQANKDQVKEISDEIEDGREIHTIKTIGYASPEGSETQNQKLSEDRAQATADYIQKNLGDKAEGITFDAKGMGSDWDGFFKALEASDIQEKAEIAETINNADDKTVAVNQMKAKYPALNDLLNNLRRTQVYINK